MALLDKKILLRVTEGERQKIQMEARQRGMSVNDFVRVKALGLRSEGRIEIEDRVTELERRVNLIEGVDN